jgi:hypothetical protein
MPAPPLPFLAADQQGRLVIMATLAYAGEVGAGERAVAPLRKLATPLADLVKPMPYPQLYPPEEEGFHPTVVFAHDVRRAGRPPGGRSDRGAPAGLGWVPACRPAAGAGRGDGPGAGRRDRVRPPRQPAHVNVAALYDGPADRVVRGAWVEEFAAALRQGDAGAYVGFLGDEDQAGVRQAYPRRTWERLAAVKRRWDPANLFHRNQNIPPDQR